ncbi:glycerophosphodiester phosphodiesterase [Thermodesulfobacteriota bacterium]
MTIDDCLGDPACDRLMTVGHRGVAYSLPENTWAAYDRAFGLGADIVEIDVRTSSDGTFVICHDSTVDRISDGEGEVAAMTVADLKALSIPADDLTIKEMDPFVMKYRTALVPPPPQAFLTLEELFDRIGGRGIIYIDFKVGDLEVLAEFVRARGFQDRIYVAARSLDQAFTLASVPGTAVMADPPDMADLDTFLSLDPVLVELTLDTITPGVVERIHEAGAKIMLNALNERDFVLRFAVLLRLKMIRPLEFLCAFFGDLVPDGVLRIQDGAFDPIDPTDLEPVEALIDRTFGQLTDAGADVIQSDFLDLLVPFARRANEVVSLSFNKQ